MQRALKGKQLTLTYKLWEWHGRWMSGMCEEQMKGEYREEEGGQGD